MRKFLYNLISFSALLITVLVVLIVISINTIDETVHNSIGWELNHKLKYLSSLKSPKMALVGGSGIALGVNSEELERGIGVPVLNTGISAAIGLAYQLDCISEYVGDGDWVAIIPEYPNFIDCLGDGSFLSMVCDVRPHDWRRMDAAQWLKQIQYFPKYGIRKFWHLIVSRFNRNVKRSEHIYNGWEYNQRGDMVSAWKETVNRGFASAPKRNVNLPDDFGMECIRRINLFKVAHPKTHVLIVPPALQDKSFDNESEMIYKIDNLLKKNQTPFIADPSRYKMPNAECWDSPYHLNGVGVRHRTKMLIEDLSKAMLIDKTK